MADVKPVIREYLSSEFGDGQPFNHADDDNLIDAEIIDSLGIFMLISFIEDRFGVAVDPEEVAVEHFQSIDRIAALVDAKL